MKRTLLALTLVLLVPLAGCNFGGTGTASPTETTAGPATTDPGTPQRTATPTPTTSTATPTPTPTATPTPTPTPAPTETAPSVRVVNGTLSSVDAGAVFERVRTLTGSDVSPPTVELRKLTEAAGFRPGAVPFYSAMGIGNSTLDPNRTGGLTYAATGKVYLFRGDGSPVEIERVLVHEFVHTVQYKSGMQPWLDALERQRRTLDLIFARSMLTEGGAVYVTDVYTERYLDARNQSAVMREHFREAPAADKILWGKYVYGSRYAHARLDDPANLASLYESPPRTTEQVMHNYTRAEEPPANLSVSPTAPAQNWSYGGNSTLGEYLTGRMLAGELAEANATAAAAGWGYDELNAFQHTNGTVGWAWTLRMDSAAEADELATHLETVAARRSATSDRSFRVVRVDDTTVSLLVGPTSFTENTTVSTDDGGVTVTVSG